MQRIWCEKIRWMLIIEKSSKRCYISGFMYFKISSYWLYLTINGNNRPHLLGIPPHHTNSFEHTSACEFRSTNFDKLSSWYEWYSFNLRVVLCVIKILTRQIKVNCELWKPSSKCFNFLGSILFRWTAERCVSDFIA